MTAYTVTIPYNTSGLLPFSIGTIAVQVSSDSYANATQQILDALGGAENFFNSNTLAAASISP